MLKINKTPAGTGIFCDRAKGTIHVTKIVDRIVVFGDAEPLIITEPGRYEVVCEALDYVEGCEFDLNLE